jgi:hypothetical protein
MSKAAAAIDDIVNSDALSAHSDGEIIIPPEAWSRLPTAGEDVIFTVHSGKGAVRTTVKVAESE